MSAPRGGRGGERGRGVRGAHNGSRGGRGRARDGSTPPTQTNAERPAQAVFTRGARGANRGVAARGPTTTTARGGASTRGNTRDQGNYVNVPASVMALDPTGATNSTPHAHHEYAKRLEHIKSYRPQLRQRFINEGKMNPEGQMRLSDSVKLIGLCKDMCPEYERVRRIVEEDVKPPECTPDTQHLPRKERIPDEARMVKAYTRSAAGMDVELVSEIRSPDTCLKTIDYLMQRLDEDDFDFLHSWIWDRTRSIRKDLRTQRIKDKSDIDTLLKCLERCGRYLLLAAHQMARSSKEDYSHQQDIEQLNATLISLQERYLDNRRANFVSANEAEFLAYRLILAPLFASSQLEDQLHGLPNHLRNNPRVQTALEIYRVMKSIILTNESSFVQSQANWKRFWDLIKSPSVSYLMACAAEVSFQRVRHVVLDGLWRAFRKGNASRPQVVDTWKPDDLKEVLGLDTAAEAVNFCESFGFQFQLNGQGQTYLDVTGKGFAKVKLGMGSDIKPQIFSNRIVEVKRFNRAFSAIVQAMSVREAKANGLMVGPTGHVDNSNSLFVPETDATKQTNPFLQKSATASRTSTNPFQGASAFAPILEQKPNPFVTDATKQARSGFSLPTAQSAVFNAAKDTIKFATPGTATTSSASLGKSNLSGSASPFNPTNLAGTAAADAPSPMVNPFLAFQKPAQQQPAATTAATTPAAAASFSGIASGNGPTQTPNASFSFTPAGSPAPAQPPLEDVEKQKAEEEEKRQQAAAEAEARAKAKALAQQQQRAREEEAQRARVEAERQRIQAEQHRQRLQQEERERIARQARECRAREEEARMARARAKDQAWDALANDCMHDTNEGLMMQFIENMVVNTAEEVVAAQEEARRKQLWEKKKELANSMYEQRLLGLKRLVVATWLNKIEKKKRAEQARARRRRLKEHKAQLTHAENTPSNIPTPAASETSVAPVNDNATFQKPKAPASARRAKRTEERHAARHPQQNGDVGSVVQPNESVQHAATQTVLTPVSMNGSQTSSLGYSEAYQKSDAPIDRTETDYFTLRAQGLDPHKFRKRSFDSASGDDAPEVETKRPRITPQSNAHPRPQSRTANEDIAARLQAVQESFRKSGGSPRPFNGAASVNGTASPNARRKSLLEQAKQALGKSTTSNASPSDFRHDWGRSVPNLGRSTNSARQSVMGKSVNMAPTDDRPAYWARKSRFVPQHLYGKGPEAVRAYRVQYGLNSPAGSRASTTEPLAVSSPIPTQTSYKPQHGYTQEEYSEEEEPSDIEIIDVDAEDEDHDEDEEVESTENEYEGDEESEEEEESCAPQYGSLYRRQSHHSHHYDEDGDSQMSDNGFEYTNGHSDTAAEALDDYEVYTEDGNDEEDTSQQHRFGQQRFQPINHGKPAPQPLKTAGNTEHDAIELSD